MSEDLTPEEKEILRQLNEGKQNVHSFFTNIIKTKDTTKTGNLTSEELGLPSLPVRTYKELALFSEDVYNDKAWADFFNRMAEIQTSTSLSKDAILLRLSVTQKKEMADVTPKERKINRGWFKKKNTGGNIQ
ncbi:MAG TPA: hypothetical protein ENG48_09215 [Candidatus Atribacteria bacterium]|nr:hypothetical protein [Candidatus Atribacteria bacterium]